MSLKNDLLNYVFIKDLSVDESLKSIREDLGYDGISRKEMQFWFNRYRLLDNPNHRCVCRVSNSKIYCSNTLLCCKQAFQLDPVKLVNTKLSLKFMAKFEEPIPEYNRSQATNRRHNTTIYRENTNKKPCTISERYVMKFISQDAGLESFKLLDLYEEKEISLEYIPSKTLGRSFQWLNIPDKHNYQVLDYLPVNDTLGLILIYRFDRRLPYLLVCLVQISGFKLKIVDIHKREERVNSWTALIHNQEKSNLQFGIYLSFDVFLTSFLPFKVVGEKLVFDKGVINVPLIQLNNEPEVLPNFGSRLDYCSWIGDTYCGFKLNYYPNRTLNFRGYRSLITPFYVYKFESNSWDAIPTTGISEKEEILLLASYSTVHKWNNKCFYLAGEIEKPREYSVIRFNYDQLAWERIEVNFIDPIKNLFFDNNEDMIIETQYSIIQNENLSESQRNNMMQNGMLDFNRDRIKQMYSFYRLNAKKPEHLVRLCYLEARQKANDFLTKLNLTNLLELSTDLNTEILIDDDSNKRRRKATTKSKNVPPKQRKRRQ